MKAKPDLKLFQLTAIMKLRLFLVIFFLMFVSAVPGFSQDRTIVHGRVTDSKTGEPLPFVNVYFNTTLEGSTTDFDGYYRIRTSATADSIVASLVGYKHAGEPVLDGFEQEIDLILEEEVVSLTELVFLSGENPANLILKEAVRQKPFNDKRTLSYYEYQSYNRIEISIDNMSKKLSENKVMRQVIEKVDEVSKLKDEKGNRIIPVFISESLSDYYVKNNPETKKEIIKKTRISGVGIEDGGFISQLIGSSFQEYNFYKNWMNILDKEFVSPLADNWKLYYDFELIDSLVVEGDSCYHLGVYPKNDEDLAFTGYMWITKNEYALRQIDVTVKKSSNLNFIESLRIQQQMVKTQEGPWLSGKTRVVIDISQISDESAGLFVKFYNSNEHALINKPYDNKFYNQSIELNEDYLEKDPVFWETNRHDTLSAEEKVFFSMVDTISSIPTIRNYADILKTIANGYHRRGKFDFGPVLYAWSINDIEGHRVRLGMRTNEYMSKFFYFRGYGAYGFDDDRFKYGAYLHFIVDRKPWTEIMLAKRYDIDQVGLRVDDLAENYFFLAATRFGSLRQPFLNDMTSMRFLVGHGNGFTQQLTLQHESFDPLYHFAYYKDLDPQAGVIADNFQDLSLRYELRFARDEKFLINGNQRISTGILRYPAIDFGYTYGIKGLFGSDFEYHKLMIGLEQRLKLGLFGISRYKISMGKVFNPVPYPILYNHIGNETIFYTTAAFNLMNYFEFVSDQYISLRYQHNFEGFILNRIPLLRKLKWRMVANANFVWGQVGDENFEIIPDMDLEGNSLVTFNSLSEKPYIELSYGIENILKVVRIDFFHRLTYLENPDASAFGARISFQIIL